MAAQPQLERTVPAELKELSVFFAAHRRQLAEALFAVLKHGNCGAGELPDNFSDLTEWSTSYFMVAVDLAGEWFSGRNHLAQSMFIGWVHSQLHETATRLEGEDYKPACVIEQVTERWSSLLQPHVGTAALAAFKIAMSQALAWMNTPTRRKLKVLFVGDCLVAEVITALGAMSLQQGIDFTSTYLHTQVPVLLRNEIRALPDGNFDLVFFSPFSNRFTLDYEALLSPRAITWPRARFFSMVDQILQDTEATLRTLVEKVNCPVYVHNTTGVMGVPPRRLRRYALYLATMKNRRDARLVINRRAASWAQDARFGNKVRLLDEEALVGKVSRIDLGRLTYHGQEVVFHPSRLGMELANGPYIEALATTALLSSKKLVVCDLDNTLWDGVIGEGAVKPYLDRQQTLKKLKQRGVLLSINSKNDPANVHFTGGALAMEDFVAPQINWEPKTKNMATIASVLNLKTKDFVFLDDRPDELARMREEFPEIVALDATDPTTWERIAHWERYRLADEAGDRTQMYHEMAAREQFLSDGKTSPDNAASEEDEAAALEKLGLTVRIETVSKSGLKRAVELINRTNQFNMAGSRTTLEAAQEGLGSDRWLFTVSAKDKFGDMGVVGVMQVDRTPNGLRVPIFVLSCRVFGMGVEYALLNTVRELASHNSELIGDYKETQHNKPGRHLFEKSGLTFDGTAWAGRISDLPADPVWLKVERAIPVFA